MALKWTAQLSVSPRSQTQSLSGDKILLPSSALEQLLAAAPVAPVAAVAAPEAGRPFTTQFDPFNPHTFHEERRARERTAQTQQQLPHPLTFRLVNPASGRVIHAGIREFSSPENEIGLSPLLRQSLGIDEGSDGELAEDRDDSASSSDREDRPTVTVHAAQLPRGSYVRLRPLEPGYDVEDWKALLERRLRDNFTTLTVGEVLPVSAGRKETFRFLVDKVEPEGVAICIIDTDLEVDIEPLDEEQARESLRRQLAKSTTTDTKGGSSVGGSLELGEEVDGQVLPGKYVDYDIEHWGGGKTLDIELMAEKDANVDIFVSPFSSRQRSRPRGDEHVFGDLSNHFPKRIRLQPTNVELEGAEALYVSVHAYVADESGREGDEDMPSTFHLRTAWLDEGSQPGPNPTEEEEMHEPGDVQCKNCQQWVPERTLFLHENFCFRNNILCDKCQDVFQKSSPEWENHWHCPHDSAHGNNSSSKLKHDSVFHTTHSCPGCDFQAASLPELAHHRTTTCPAKLILCQFCHLIVPQKGGGDPEMLDPEVLLSGLTPHELVDGGRTTECHLCNKIIRLRDMKTHLRHHDLDRMSRPPPRICINPNCSRTINGGATRKPGASNAADDSLGLCSVCFGPLYADLYDPEGKALRRRIERRYLSQMLKGCGKSWCRNEFCKTGRENLNNLTAADNAAAAGGKPSLAPKEATSLVKPLIDAVSVHPGSVNTTPLHFCTDEATQRRRTLTDMLSAEEDNQYESGWCVAAVENASGDVEKAREWLVNWAPKRGERS